MKIIYHFTLISVSSILMYVSNHYSILLVTITSKIASFFECIKQLKNDHAVIQRPLDGFAYPVYTTEVCPKNLTEWQERSSAFNCNKTNAYMCVPNENFTELLEFCYSGPQIRIVKGKNNLTIKQFAYFHISRHNVMILFLPWHNRFNMLALFIHTLKRCVVIMQKKICRSMHSFAVVGNYMFIFFL